MKQWMQCIVFVGIIISLFWFYACDADSDVSSVSPFSTVTIPNNMQEEENGALIRLHICDISVDQIEVIEVKWGLGEYESVDHTPFSKSIRLNKQKVVSWETASESSCVVICKTNINVTDNQNLFFNIRLLTAANVCIGNLKQIWQGRIDTDNDSEVIDVTIDGVYGDQTIFYKKR